MDLSIILLSYNQEKFISKAIDSIVSQVTNCDFEVIIGDDCSNDGTQKIILEYANKYPLVIKPIIREKNLGLIDNYFSLVSECKGEYIMECAGDDYWLPGKLYKQLNFMENNPDVSMVCSGYQRVDENNNYISTDIAIPKTDFYSLYKGNQIAALTVCFRRTLIEKYIDEVNPVRRNWKMEDYPFWLWISLNGKIAFIPEVLCSYRIVKGSISHPKSIDNMIGFESSVYDIRLYFARNDAERKYAYTTFVGNISVLIFKNKGFISMLKQLLNHSQIIVFIIFVLRKIKEKMLDCYIRNLEY